MEIEETALPGIGLRYDFETSDGHRVGVVSHRSGRRELVVYDTDDPDTGRTLVSLTDEEGDTLAELLGAPRIVEKLADLHRQVEGLVTREVRLAVGSPYDGRTLGDTRARTRTGASVVAVVRDGRVHASVRPDFQLAGGDTVVVTGTAEGTAAVADLLARG